MTKLMTKLMMEYVMMKFNLIKYTTTTQQNNRDLMSILLCKVGEERGEGRGERGRGGEWRGERGEGRGERGEGGVTTGIFLITLFLFY